MESCCIPFFNWSVCIVLEIQAGMCSYSSFLFLFLTAAVKWSSFYPPPLIDGHLHCLHFSLLLPRFFSVCFSRMYRAESQGCRLYVIFFLGSLSSPGPEGLLLYILIIFSIFHTFSSCRSVKSEPVSHCGLHCSFDDYCSDGTCLWAMGWLIYTPILFFTHFFPVRLLPILILILCLLCGANTWCVADLFTILIASFDG